MNHTALVGGLALITLVIVITALVIDRIGLEKAKKEHHHSAATDSAPAQKNG